MTICSKCGRNCEEVVCCYCISAEIAKSVQCGTRVKPQTVDEFDLRGATTGRWTSRSPVQRLPMPPEKYRKLLLKILEANPSMTISQFAAKLNKPEAWLQRILDDPEILREAFNDSVACCIRANPDYTREEILALLKKEEK